MCEITERKLQAVKNHFGSWANLAEVLGTSAAAVSQWISDGGIPPKRAIFIEGLMKGSIKAVELIKKEDAQELAQIMKGLKNA